MNGQAYLVSQGVKQTFGVYRVRPTDEGFTLVPEDGGPVGIEPGLLMLIGVVDGEPIRSTELR